MFIGPPRPPRSLRCAYRSTTLQVRIATLARLCEAYVLPGFFCVETHALVKAGRLDAAMDVLRRCVVHGGCTIDVCRQCLRLLALAPGTIRHQVNAAFAAVFTAFSDPAAGKIDTPLFPVRGPSKRALLLSLTIQRKHPSPRSAYISGHSSLRALLPNRKVDLFRNLLEVYHWYACGAMRHGHPM